MGEGDVYGQRVKLRGFQRRYLYRLYEYYPETRRRRYRRALFGAGKGSGKSPLDAWIGAYELAGGVNLSPRVIIGAASLKQANLVYGDFTDAVTGDIHDPSPLKSLVEVGAVRTLLRGAPGVAERIAAAVGTNDGARATCFLADELHEWRGTRARVFTVVDGAIAKRENAFSQVSSTAGIDDEEPDNILKTLYDYGVRVSSGELVDDRFLFEWYESDPGLNLEDPDQWLLAMRQANPALGDFTSLENLRYRFETIARHEFLRYHCNRFVKASDIWEVARLWAALEDQDVDLDPDLALHVGIDVGWRHDSTAVVAAQLLPDRRVIVRSRVWENPHLSGTEAHDSWKLDVGAVKKHLRELWSSFPIAAREDAGPAFFYDPYLFEEAAADLADDGLNMLEYPQSDTRMVAASQRLFQLVKEDRIVHDGDPTLSRHMSNVVPHEKPNGWRISKPRGSRRHIDAAVAAAIAVREATRTEEDEPQKTPSLHI